MTHNKTIWITGASSGIGAALAKVYHDDGYKVILSGRNKDKLNKVTQTFSNNDNYTLLPFDVNDFGATNIAIEKLKNELGTPNIIILNAGISQRSLAVDTDIKVTEQLIRTNLISNINITKSLLPDIIINKTHIGVISSVTGKLGPTYRSSYAASKHALHGYYDSLRAEVGHLGVKITLICPGYINTNISINALTGNGSAQNTMDVDTANGLEPLDLANRIKKAIAKGKSEVYFGGKEIYAIYLKRYFPSLLEKILGKVKPK